MTHPVYLGTKKPNLTVPIWVVVVSSKDTPPFLDYTAIQQRIRQWPDTRAGKKRAKDRAFYLNKKTTRAEVKLAKIEVL